MPLLARWTSNVAVSGGLTTPADGIKAIPGAADGGLIEWMEREQLASLDDVKRRLSLERAREPSALERAQYIHTLQSWHT